MKKTIVILILAAVLAAPVSAQDPGVFADIGGGARPAAMGNAFVAVADDATE